MGAMSPMSSDASAIVTSTASSAAPRRSRPAAPRPDRGRACCARRAPADAGVADPRRRARSDRRPRRARRGSRAAPARAPRAPPTSRGRLRPRGRRERRSSRRISASARSLNRPGAKTMRLVPRRFHTSQMIACGRDQRAQPSSVRVVEGGVVHGQEHDVGVAQRLASRSRTAVSGSCRCTSAPSASRIFFSLNASELRMSSMSRLNARPRMAALGAVRSGWRART